MDSCSAGIRLGAQPLEQLRRGLVLRGRGRVDGDRLDGLRLGCALGLGVLRRRLGQLAQDRQDLGARRRAGHALGRGESRDDLAVGLRAGRLGQVGDHEERPVHAGTEALGTQVVGDARRRALGLAGVVGEALAQAEHRDGEDDDDGEREQRRDDRLALQDAAVVRPRAALGVALEGSRLLAPRQPPGEGLGAEQAQQRRQHPQRRQHDHEHGHGGGDREAVEEVDAEHEQAEQGDDDGAAGEQDGAAGGLRRTPSPRPSARGRAAGPGGSGS